MAAFSDHFSKVAAGYSEYRPGYPPQLFDLLHDVVGNTQAGRERATSSTDANANANAITDANAKRVVWDCAAGTGQASVALAERFPFVLATDASASQIRQAVPHDNIRYTVATAEHCPLRSQRVSLVTVAQALHWFNIEAFFREVNRVLVPGGVIAVWCYGLLRVDDNRDVESAIDHFSEVTVGPWWPPERVHIDAGYSDLPFPFDRLETPPIDMTARWSANQMLGYLRTWSSVSRKRAADGGRDPVETFVPVLRDAWGDTDQLNIRWPVSLLVGIR